MYMYTHACTCMYVHLCTCMSFCEIGLGSTVSIALIDCTSIKIPPSLNLQSTMESLFLCVDFKSRAGRQHVSLLVTLPQ